MVETPHRLCKMGPRMLPVQGQCEDPVDDIGDKTWPCASLFGLISGLGADYGRARCSSDLNTGPRRALRSQLPGSPCCRDEDTEAP